MAGRSNTVSALRGPADALQHSLYAGVSLTVKLDGLKMNRALKRGGRQKWQQSETRGMGIHRIVRTDFRPSVYVNNYQYFSDLIFRSNILRSKQ